MQIESFDALLKAPPGAPTLDLYSFEGTEALSRLYSYSVVGLVKPAQAVNLEDLLGKPAELIVKEAGGADRHYHGLIASARFEGTIAKRHGYRLELVPWLWLLTRSANVRVFQNMSVLEIIKKVFEAYGGAIKVATTATYHKREYCVQYRESDFNFVSRLMEDEGIYYFFRHSAGKHEMVLADAAGVHVSELGTSTINYKVGAPRRTHNAVVTRWSWSRQIQTGKVTLRDHHFVTPTNNYENVQTGSASYPHGTIEAYDYAVGLPQFADENGSGHMKTVSVDFAKHRLQAFQSGVAAVDGSTNSVRLCNGARFKLAQHPVMGQDGEYIVQSTRIRVRIAGYESGADKDSTHECEFTAFPSAVPFRAPRITPKPRVHGLHSATVVGPAGEEIFVDKYGRVKVQFHWDREGAKDDKSSCFVRVAQASAGKQFGVVMLPRIGHEVVVDFLEGDPDQPLIVGAVYNADNMPPYALPANATISTIKTNSSKGGGGFNELKFEDKKGEELVFLQAQKDLTENILNDVKTDIGNDLTLTIKNNRTEMVTEGKFDVTVKTGKHNLKVQDDIAVTTKNKYTLDATSDVTIESKTKITLKVGGSTIVLEPTKVKIQTAQIEVNADATMAFKSGAKADFDGGGMMTIKAGLVKVN